MTIPMIHSIAPTPSCVISAVEWVVGIVVVVGLLLLAARTSRRALTRS